MYNTPLVGSLSSPQAKYQLYIELLLDSKEDTTVYCGAFNALAAVNKPVSGDDIINQNFRSLVANVRPYVLIENLIPSTLYNVFCMTQSLIGNQMPYKILIKNKIQASTLCCKVATVTTTTSSVYVSSTTFGLFQLSVDFAPIHTLNVALKTTDGNATTRGQFYPTTLSIPTTAAANTIYSAAFTSSAVPGNQTLNVTLFGLSAKEYELRYGVRNDSFHTPITILTHSLNVPPPVPVMTSAQFTSDGSALVVTFSSLTDKGGALNSFDCGSVFWFKKIANALCSWMDFSRVQVLFVSSQSGVKQSPSSFLNVGDGIKINRNNKIRAFCGVTNTTACMHYDTVVSANVTVLSPSSPALPNVVINAPPQIGACTDLTLDLTSSTGSSGRDWLSSEYHVLDSIDRVAYALETFLNNHTLFRTTPPRNTIPYSMLSAGHVYTFQITLCNFLNACSTSSKSVTISNSTQLVPIISILSDVFTVQTSDKSVSLQATAYTLNCISDVPKYNNLKYVWKLPAFILQPKITYKIALTVTSTISRLSSTTFTTIQVADGSLVSVLKGANSVQKLKIGSFLALDGSQSYDTNYKTDAATISKNALKLNYKWSCLQIAPEFNPSVCLLNLNVQRNTTYTHFNRLNITFLNTANFTSMVNITYRVTLTVNDATRTSSSVTDVMLVSSEQNLLSVAAVSPLALNSAGAIVNSVNQLSLLASLQIVAPCTAQWSVDDLSLNLTQLALVPVHRVFYGTGLVASSTRVQSYSLLLRANALPQRETLVFTLTCSGPISRTSTSITIVTNGGPLPGTFSISPSTGSELTTSFLFSANQFTDSDLPLTYQIAYLRPTLTSSSSSGSAEMLTLFPRSVSTFGTSFLPAGHEYNDYNLTCVLSVYDVYSAVTNVNKTVRVLSSFDDDGDQYAAINLLVATAASGVNSVAQNVAIVNVIATLINTVDCSGAANCTALNRVACLGTANTCGACLSSYVGDLGDKNTLCLSPASYKSLLAKNAINTRVITPYNSSLPASPTNFNYTGPHPTKCKRDKDCGSAWYKCHLIPGNTPTFNFTTHTAITPLIANNTCLVIDKQCDNDCNSQGLCQFRQTSTNAVLSECKVTDSTCVATCLCDRNFFGSSCDLDYAAMKKLQCMRSQLVSTLRNVTRVDDVNDDNVISWSSSLCAIATNAYQVSLSDAQGINEIAGTIVTNANILDLRQYQSILGALTSVDTIASVTSFSDIVCANPFESIVTVRNNTPGQSILSIASQFGSLVASKMVPGQTDNQYVYDNFRISVAVRSLSALTDTSTGSEQVLTPFTIESPQSVYEQVMVTAVSSVSVQPSDLNSDAQSESTSLVTSLIETRSKMFEEPVAVRLLSNSYFLMVSTLSNDVTSNTNTSQNTTATLQ
eukprot:gene30758-38018_t